MPGGDEQLLVVDLRAGLGTNGFPPGIDGGNRGAEKQFDRQLAVSSLAEHLPGWRRLLGREGDLRQRRPVVGQMRLGTEQENASLGALGPQGFHRRGAGQATADDDEIKVLGHVSVFVILAAASVNLFLPPVGNGYQKAHAYFFGMTDFSLSRPLNITKTCGADAVTLIEQP